MSYSTTTVLVYWLLYTLGVAFSSSHWFWLFYGKHYRAPTGECFKGGPWDSLLQGLEGPWAILKGQV